LVDGKILPQEIVKRALLPSFTLVDAKKSIKLLYMKLCRNSVLNVNINGVQ